MTDANPALLNRRALVNLLDALLRLKMRFTAFNKPDWLPLSAPK